MDKDVGIMSESSGPLGGLPPADRSLLVDPPLELAVAEIRFLGRAPALSPEVGLGMRDRLADANFRFAKLEEAQEGRVTIDLGQAGDPSSQVQTVARGWQLIEADDQVQLTVLPEALVVQTGKYERW